MSPTLQRHLSPGTTSPSPLPRPSLRPEREPKAHLIHTARQVHLDLYRPGAPPTQPELMRVTGQERVANAFLVETARRLLGRR